MALIFMDSIFICWAMIVGHVDKSAHEKPPLS